MSEDPTCTDCGGTGETYQTERRCACQPNQMSEAAKHTPRDELMLLIGSFPLHTDDRGDDNLVLHDAFAGDYDTRTEAIYQLVDDILAAISEQISPRRIHPTRR